MWCVCLCVYVRGRTNNEDDASSLVVVNCTINRVIKSASLDERKYGNYMVPSYTPHHIESQQRGRQRRLCRESTEVGNWDTGQRVRKKPGIRFFNITSRDSRGIREA
ncbi:uncharacterized protein LOC122636583 [Vespula pensylvanica]|uniref:uncharacterized protein LOC122636583 n=1 Tax=Vespula pensylvanica TaxID=30213 RepID=UPI001CB9EDE9|nr:uncharacterized protein LOC122636583 [Vespula pensylvanica]